MDKENIEKLINNVDEDVEYINKISNDIVNKYTKDLDELMIEINKNVVIVDNVSDIILEKYFTELSNALYFVGSNCERLGFFDDIAKSNAKLKYNNTYVDIQSAAAVAGAKSKLTVAELQIAAENGSIEESVVSSIYSRSFKIIKSKIDFAQTMVSTLSKLLTKHIQEQQLSSMQTGRKILNEEF